jgi:hypothetical protein
MGEGISSAISQIVNIGDISIVTANLFIAKKSISIVANKEC